eukprot:g54882.t1
MTNMLLWGCILVAYGPPTIIFLLMLSRKSQLVIVFLLAAFIWVASFLVTSILWSIFSRGLGFEDDWFTILLGVLCQEVSRLLFCNLYMRFENTFTVVSTNAVAFPIVDFYCGLAGGLGFGVANSVMIYGTVISYADGPGVYYADTCSIFNAFVLSAWLGLAFCLLHIGLMIIALDAIRRRSPHKFLAVLAIHLLAAELTSLNLSKNGCLYSIPLIFGIVFATGAWTWHVISRNDYHSKQRFD